MDLTTLKRDIPWTKNILSGKALLENAFASKGMAFSWKERRELNLHGLLPPRVESIQKQAKRVMWNLRRMEDDLEKYQFIMGLADSNARLFYYVLSEFVQELMPIVYTPLLPSVAVWVPACLIWSIAGPRYVATGASMRNQSWHVASE